MSTQQMIELQALAAKCDMRVGQLINNAIGLMIDKTGIEATDGAIGNRLFYIRDTELMVVCRRYVEWYINLRTA